jgi:hypothetical protein
METLHMIVQEGSAHKRFTPPGYRVLAFICPRLVCLSLNAVLNATSKELKRPLSFKRLERVMIRGFLKLPI